VLTFAINALGGTDWRQGVANLLRSFFCGVFTWNAVQIKYCSFFFLKDSEKVMAAKSFKGKIQKLRWITAEAFRHDAYIGRTTCSDG
jgi:hypothetical protein